MEKFAFIKHLPSGEYQVQSSKGKPMGTYKTREQAEKRLAQIEMFKHMKSKKKKAEEEFYFDALEILFG